MANQIQQLHFLFVPLMSQSHLIPFTEMAKLLAHHGMSVTIVVTPVNALRYNKLIDYAKNLNLNIKFLSLRFPCPEVGLPDGCENLDSLPSPDLTQKFFEASNMVQKPLEKWLGELESESLPDCIVSDVCFPWTSDVALHFKIPRIVFQTVSCFTLACSHSIDCHRIIESITSPKPFLVPDMPDNIEFTEAQLPITRSTTSDYMRDCMKKFKEAGLSADGVLVNSFEELESRYMKEYQKTMKNTWCIGPLFLANSINSEKYNKAPVHEHKYLKWLDSRKSSSVLYVCFGSLSSIQPQQLMEIGLGLEASNCSFIWAIRKDHLTYQLEKWLEEEKFEERIQGRGLIVQGWAPQVSILSHPSVGGFLTHCGWNSTLEGISAGKPMITWPMFAEQFFNEKLIVQVLKIGVRVGVEHENTQLRMENEKLRADNMRYREALGNTSCPNCGGPTAVGKLTFDEQHLILENTFLRDEIDRFSAIVAKYVGILW
ncbi:hypothetical protein EZV62_016231 [Acer yangbiense]|uniref:Glycosyltransferase n=1 Tax=Acer yangbiense TaxID=1000413 RepID=A0A5C7HQA5_9ROSI|nr:hypothetical protein EZV62_016231 [Acer yangbiense]